MSTEEQNNHAVQTAVNLSAHITDKFPQTSNITIDLADDLIVEAPPLPEGIVGLKKVDYVIAGSLSTMLLSQASEFTELRMSNPPYFLDGKTRLVPEKAQTLFTEFARQVGDFDYIPSKDYILRRRRAGEGEDRKKYLGGGGGSLLLHEMPPEVMKAIKIEDYQTTEGSSFHVDPLESLLPDKVIRVDIKGQDYFLPSPDTMVAYKTVNMLESYVSGNEEKRTKFNKDMPRLLEAIGEMYPEKELIETTHDLLAAYDAALKDVYRVFHQDEDPTLSHYESKVPGMITTLLEQEDLNPLTKDFLTKLAQHEAKNEAGVINDPFVT